MPSPHPPAEPDPLEDLVAAFVERREEEPALSPEAFAAEHPDAGVGLLAALRRLARTEAAFPTGVLGVPPRIGGYVVRSEIGRGAMGRVLEVEAEGEPGGVRALKLLHVALETNPRSLERFRREGQALERIRHPCVVRFHEVGVAEGSAYIVMERVVGESLAARLRRDVEPPAKARAPSGPPGSSRSSRARSTPRTARACCTGT